jgi:hypothetical protein
MEAKDQIPYEINRAFRLVRRTNFLDFALNSSLEILDVINGKLLSTHPVPETLIATLERTMPSVMKYYEDRKTQGKLPSCNL